MGDWIDELVAASRRSKGDPQQEQLDREKRELGWGPPPPLDHQTPSHPERTAELEQIREEEGDEGLERRVARTAEEWFPE